MDSSDIFREKLCAVAGEEHSEDDLQQLSYELMRAFLDDGSETPDNLNCVEHVELGWVRNREFGPKSVCGLKLKNKDILVSDVVYLVEDEEVPKLVQERYPELTSQEWLATMRMVTMILSALEKNQWR